MAKTLIGLDIGNSDVKMARARGGSAKLVAERLPENLMKDNRIAAPELLARFIKKTKSKSKLRGYRCAVILPEYSTFFRRMSIPVMSAEKIALNLPYEFRDYTGGESMNYNYDYIIERVNRDGAGNPVSIDLVAAAAQKAVVKEYRDLLRRAGLRLTVALPREMALINLLHNKVKTGGEADKEYCLVDIGHEHTRVYIFRGDALKASKIIDLGCSRIDAAISDKYNIDVYLAATYRDSNYENALESEECREVYERISLEIRKAVNFYSYDNQQNTLNDIYFCGGGADIKQLVDTITADVGFTSHPITNLLPKYGDDLAGLSRCAMAIGAVL